MTGSATPRALSPAWVVVVTVLSTAPVLKLGDVQLVEAVQCIWIAIYIASLSTSRLTPPTDRLWRDLRLQYGIFLVLSTAISILSFRLSFYPPPNISLLKQPGFVSLSRLFELGLAIWFMLVLAASMARRQTLLRLALSAYCAAGLVSAIASIVSFGLEATLGWHLYPVYGRDHRVRGFLNEGGPYGLFLISVILAALLRARYFPPRSRIAHRFAVLTLIVALGLSGSKAGILAAAALCLFGVIVSTTTRQRFVLAALLVLTTASFVLLFRARFVSYVYTFSNFQMQVYMRQSDPNLVMGRIVAVFIVPRMILAHPLLGIGLGNYSLMRNDPDYLRGLPPADQWDLPGLGLIGVAAEMGVPLTIYFFLILLKPMRYAKLAKAPAVLRVAAAFQPAAVLLGVNLNFFYPWLFSAFALSFIFYEAGEFRVSSYQLTAHTESPDSGRLS